MRFNIAIFNKRISLCDYSDGSLFSASSGTRRQQPSSDPSASIRISFCPFPGTVLVLCLQAPAETAASESSTHDREPLSLWVNELVLVWDLGVE